MKTLLLLALVALAMHSLTAQPVSDPDMDRSAVARKLVADVMQFPASSHVSFYETDARRLGDRVAVAILQVMRVDRMVQPDNAKRAITLLEDAFSDVSFIKDEDDRRPSVALLVLLYLTEHGPESSRERAIRAFRKLSSDHQLR